MAKKCLLFAVALVLFGILIAPHASAITVKFETRDYFAWGRLYNPVTGAATNTNPYDGSTTQTLTPGTYFSPDGTEDAFGITAITRITNLAGTVTYWEENANRELTAFFWGADDVYLGAVNPDTLQSTLMSDGFFVELWLDTTPNYDITQGTAGRTGVADYTTVTDDGEMVLSLAGHTQYRDYFSGGTAEPFTLQETGYADTGDFTGSIMLDVTGGTWAWMYDTNTRDPLRSDGMADFNFSFSTHNVAGQTGVSDWLIGDTSNAIGDVVPEPASMLLLGSGLLGLAGLGRRRFKK
jgi:hypothetical protein